MTDSFRRHTRSLTSPPEHGVAVAPDDAADLAAVTRALWVGGGGDLAVRMQDGTDAGAGRRPRRHAAADPGGAGARHRDHGDPHRRPLVMPALALGAGVDAGRAAAGAPLPHFRRS